MIRNLRSLSAAVVPVCSLLALAACSSGGARPVEVATVTASPSPDVSAEEDGASVTEAGSETEETSPSTSGSAAAPEVGDLVKLSPDWEVKLVSVNTDADQLVLSANAFNDLPKGKYILVTYAATYTGREKEGSLLFGMDWQWITPDQRIHNSFDSDAVTPADMAEWPDHARRGGTIKGQVVFDIPSEKISGSTLSVVDGANDNLYVDHAIK